MPSSDSASSPSLLDRVRARFHRKGYSYRTEQSYTRWIVRYVKYHDTTHPQHLDKQEVRAYLSYLATDRHLAASTQNQALSALLFLYRGVLGRDWEAITDFERAKEPERLPVVLTPQEVNKVLEAMEGPNGLIAHLLYGSGLRLSEALRLRAKDLDFDYGQIVVRQGKGKKDRTTLFPTCLKTPLRRQLHKSRAR